MFPDHCSEVSQVSARFWIIPYLGPFICEDAWDTIVICHQVINMVRLFGFTSQYQGR